MLCLCGYVLLSTPEILSIKSHVVTWVYSLLASDVVALLSSTRIWLWFMQTGRQSERGPVSVIHQYRNAMKCIRHHGMTPDISDSYMNNKYRRFSQRKTLYIYCCCQLVCVSMALCKTAVTPLLTHWSYYSLALNHRYVFGNHMYLEDIRIMVRMDFSLVLNIIWAIFGVEYYLNYVYFTVG